MTGIVKDLVFGPARPGWTAGLRHAIHHAAVTAPRDAPRELEFEVSERLDGDDVDGSAGDGSKRIAVDRPRRRWKVIAAIGAKRTGGPAVKEHGPSMIAHRAR